MRYLTIKRHKSLIGWAVQLRIYIEDPFSPELDICGVPCRLLGMLKNNQEKSFPIGLESRRIFIVPQVRSRDLYNTPFTIPYGQENIYLAGKFCQENGLMPFRLDGITPTQEQLQREQKLKKRSILISVCGVLVVLGLLFILRSIDFGRKAKTFSMGDFSITLTTDFKQAQYEDSYVAYDSDEASVMVIQEKNTYDNIFDYKDDPQYLAELQQDGITLHQKNTLVWLSFTENVDGLNYYYEAYFYEEGDTLWTVMFVTPAGRQDKYESKFFKWAGTVQFDQQV